MKKVMIIATLLAGFMLGSCGNNAPKEPEIETTPEYAATYKRMLDDTKMLGEEIDGVQNWTFYTKPTDTTYKNIYYCEFNIIDNKLFGSAVYEVEEKVVESIDLFFSDKQLSSNEVSYYNVQVGEEMMKGCINFGTYNRNIKNVNLKKNNSINDDSTLETYNVKAAELLNFYLETLNEMTSYKLADLGFGSFIY